MSNPKLFISYAWTSPDHEEWVENFAKELTSSAGVYVHLDKWDLKEGNDAITFMESMVNDPEITKVVMVCDKEYVEKTNARTGGVGTEAQIISKQIYESTTQNKFVAVAIERDENVTVR